MGYNPSFVRAGWDADLKEAGSFVVSLVFTYIDLAVPMSGDARGSKNKDVSSKSVSCQYSDITPTFFEHLLVVVSCGQLSGAASFLVNPFC